VDVIGSVYIYKSVESMWSFQSKILATDGAPSDCYGMTVSIYGTIAMVGARVDDDTAVDAGV
jgi:hypothetical protein